MGDVNLDKKVSRLNGLLQRRKMRRRANLGPAGDPTRGQGRILAMLKLQDGISTKDLSYLLDLRIASLNELLGKLERAGLIVREPSEADRRVMLIRLTEAGRSQPQQDPDTGDAFAVLSAEEQETLSGFLDRVIESLDEENEAANPDALDDWLYQARSRMDDAKFDELVNLLGSRAEDYGYGYQVMLDKLRRGMSRAERRMAQEAGREERRWERRGWRGGPGFGPRADGPRPGDPGFCGPGGPGGPRDPRRGFGPRGRDLGDPRPGFDPDDGDGDEPPEGWR